MYQSLFTETFVAQLPSPSNCRSILNHENSQQQQQHSQQIRIKDGIDHNDDGNKAHFGKRHKMATKNHSIEIKFDDKDIVKSEEECNRKLIVKVDRLPHINNNNNDGFGGGGGGGRRRRL